MRPATLLATVSAFALVAVGLTGTAYAAPGLVDGSITVGDTTCTWAGATTSDVPPNTLTVDRTTVNESCSGGTTVDLVNDPTVTFDDTAGTASSPQIDVTGTIIGITCGYRVSNVSVTRQDTTRTYTGGPFTATLTSGGFLCPSSQTVDSATFTFH